MNETYYCTADIGLYFIIIVGHLNIWTDQPILSIYGNITKEKVNDRIEIKLLPLSYHGLNGSSIQPAIILVLTSGTRYRL